MSPLSVDIEKRLESHITRERRWAREKFDKVMTKGPPAVLPEFSRGKMVVEEALKQLKLGIKEPTRLFKNGAPNIDGYIRLTGLQWNTADAITWKKNAPYIKNGQFQWCGAFAAHCYAAAGLKLNIRHDFFSSATRLFDQGPNGDWSGLENGRRLVRKEMLSSASDGDGVDPGDLLVMGYFRKGKPVPSHIGLAVEGSNCGFTELDRQPPILTIEGNAMGYPFGWDKRGFKSSETKYEGVIMQKRKLFPGEGEYGILRVIRPIEEDYEK